MRVSKGDKIHYYICHVTMEAKAKTACGRVVNVQGLD